MIKYSIDVGNSSKIITRAIFKNLELLKNIYKIFLQDYKIIMLIRIVKYFKILVMNLKILKPGVRLLIFLIAAKQRKINSIWHRK